jgi:hypothetical protein
VYFTPQWECITLPGDECGGGHQPLTPIVLFEGQEVIGAPGVSDNAQAVQDILHSDSLAETPLQTTTVSPTLDIPAPSAQDMTDDDKTLVGNAYKVCQGLYLLEMFGSPLGQENLKSINALEDAIQHVPTPAVLSDGLKKCGNIADGTGGFTDIWRGEHKGTLVAIKNFRIGSLSQQYLKIPKVSKRLRCKGRL